MKKGFTMIELIFVIVILGILASVAIPRLAATKTDAETSATIGNVRTLISDASAYYVAQGQFGTDTTFQKITNVKVANNGATLLTGTDIQASGKNCINIKFSEAAIDANGKLTKPALATVTLAANADNICKQVAAAPAIKALIDAKYDGTNAGIAIGSGTSIYSVDGTPGNGQQNN